MSGYIDALNKLDYCWGLQEPDGTTFSPVKGSVIAQLENTAKTIDQMTGAGPTPWLQKSIYLDGSGECIDIDTDPIAGEGSVGLWYYQDTASLPVHTFFGHHSLNSKLRTDAGTTRRVSLRLVNGGSTVTPDHSVNLQFTWHHIVVRRNADDTVDLFVDGTLIEADVFSGPVTADIDFSRCGANQAYADPLEGYVAQVFKTGQTLTDDDIYNLYKGPFAKEYPDNKYSILMCGDTQTYPGNDSTNRAFLKITQWVKDSIEKHNNPYNLVYFAHLGDVVNDGNSSTSYDRANLAMDTLNDVIPYSVLPGNHDWNSTAVKTSGIANYVAAMGKARFEDKGFTWYGGHDTSELNSYNVIQIDGIDVLQIALEWEPQDGTPSRDIDPLDWAESVIQAHAGMPTIITTHDYLYDNGNGLTTTAGTAIWNQLIAPYNQVFLIMNGHQHSTADLNDGEYFNLRENNDGNKVLEIVGNFQDYPYAGGGWIKLVTMDLLNNEIEVKTFTPFRNEEQTETVEEVGQNASHFKVAIDLRTRFYLEEKEVTVVELTAESIREELDNNSEISQNLKTVSSPYSSNLILANSDSGAIQDVLGEYPVCTEAAFERKVDFWGDVMLEMCPLERETTYYFSVDGNDSNDGLSPTTPKQTLSEMNSLLGPGVRARLKRGDVFRNVTQNDANGGCVSDYGTGPKPRVTACTRTIEANTAAWTNAAGNRWTTSLSDVGTIHPQSWPVHLELTPADSSAEVESNANTQWTDGTTVHVNFNGIDPNTVAWEANNTTEFVASRPGIRLDEPGSRVENIVCDRQGVNHFGSSGNQQWGIMSITENNEVGCIVNCECYVHALHNIGHLNSFTAGGILLMQGCKFGSCSIDTATNFVSYAFNGANQSLLRDCEIVSGAIWKVSESSILDRANRGVYAHTGSANDIDFTCALRCTTPKNEHTTSCPDFGSWGDAPDDGGLIENVRCILYKCNVGRGIEEYQSVPWYNDTAVVACKIYQKPANDTGTRGIDGSPRRGWLIASYLEFDWDAYDIGNTSLPVGIQNSAASNPNPRLYHNHIHMKNGKADSTFCWSNDRYNSTEVALTSHAVNNIFSSDDEPQGTTNARYFMNIGNLGSASSGTFFNNAHSGWYRNGSGERGFTTWQNTIAPDRTLAFKTLDEKLAGQGNVLGAFVEVNIEGEQLVNPGGDIGPYGLGIVLPKTEKTFAENPTAVQIRQEIDNNSNMVQDVKRTSQLVVALQ